MKLHWLPRTALTALLCSQYSWAVIISKTVNPKAKAINHVCILPVDAAVSKIGFKGGERLIPDSEQWALKLEDAIRTGIKDANGVLVGDLSPETMNSDEPLRQTVVRLKQKYNSVSVQMRRKPGQVKKGRYTLGDEVALLPCASTADSLVFVHAAGTLQTAGRKTASILAGGLYGVMASQSRFDIQVAFVDAMSGDVTVLLQTDGFGSSLEKDPESSWSKALSEHLRQLGMGTGRSSIAPPK
jgi:hypothetical protein